MQVLPDKDDKCAGRGNHVVITTTCSVKNVSVYEYYVYVLRIAYELRTEQCDEIERDRSYYERLKCIYLHGPNVTTTCTVTHAGEIMTEQCDQI